MKNVNKLIRDHKRLVLGSTGKYATDIKNKENVDFQNLLRSYSCSIKLHEGPKMEENRQENRQRRCSLEKVPKMLSDHFRATEKPRPEETQTHAKLFSTHITHIQKREKLTIGKEVNSPPLAYRAKEPPKCRPFQPLQRLFQVLQPNPFEGLVQEMVAHLRQHSILNATSQLYFSVNKNHLQEIFSNSINLIARPNSTQSPSRCVCPQLTKILSSMVERAEEQNRLARREKLRLKRSVLQVSVQDGNDLKACESRVMQLTAQKKQLEERVQQLSKYQTTLKEEIQTGQALFEKNKRQLQQLHRCAYQKQEELQKLREAVSTANAEHQRLLLVQQRVRNFISEQQTNRIIKEVFQEYKQIEADIYEYAAYLQSNQLASDLYYEPHPFAAIEEQLQEGLRTVNAIIMQNREQSLEDKCMVMRDFVLDAMGKFHRKDEEMGKVLEFRTKCILRFIQNMKKWLNNWEFKQEFLVGLRKEFAHNSDSLQQKLTDFPAPPGKQGELKEIRQLTKKIVENYQMGNSFY